MGLLMQQLSRVFYFNFALTPKSMQNIFIDMEVSHCSGTFRVQYVSFVSLRSFWTMQHPGVTPILASISCPPRLTLALQHALIPSLVPKLLQFFQPSLQSLASAAPSTSVQHFPPAVYISGLKFCREILKLFISNTSRSSTTDPSKWQLRRSHSILFLSIKRPKER